jgi:hypothetical protein
VVREGVVILGPTNLPSEIPYHASQMFSANITRFLLHLAENGAIELNMDDEIVAETLVAHGGDIPHVRIRELLDLPALPESPGKEEEVPAEESDPEEDVEGAIDEDLDGEEAGTDDERDPPAAEDPDDDPGEEV